MGLTLLSLHLASLYEQDKQVDLAIEQYEAILQINPQAIMAANNLAYLLTVKRGDPKSLQKALALTKDFEKKSSNPLLLDTLALVYYKLGQNSDALSLLRKAVPNAPKHPLVNYHYGLAALKAGDSETAKQYIEKAIQTGVSFDELKEARKILADLKRSS